MHVIAFPSDATETTDTDEDGVGDNPMHSRMTHQKQLIPIQMVLAIMRTHFRMILTKH